MSLISNWKKDQNNEYQGEVWRYLAGENIEKYQPVCFNFDGNGDMVISKIHNLTTDEHYLGVEEPPLLEPPYSLVEDVDCHPVKFALSHTSPLSLTHRSNLS
jgi:hypothetical protein